MRTFLCDSLLHVGIIENKGKVQSEASWPMEGSLQKFAPRAEATTFCCKIPIEPAQTSRWIRRIRQIHSFTSMAKGQTLWQTFEKPGDVIERPDFSYGKQWR